MPRNLKLNLLLMFSLLMIGCAYTSNGTSSHTSYNELIEKYSNDYFFGVGNGSAKTEQLAIKIAKIKALGSLSENIKVTILSKTEMNQEETVTSSSYEFTESFKAKIIAIGNATVRSPDYEILNVSNKSDKFHVEMLAKKLKSEHIIEAANDLDFGPNADSLLELIK